LYVDENGVSEERAEENSEHPPIKERELLKFLFGMEIVELVGADCGDVGFGSTCSHGKRVERAEEHCKL
jgi:hypothetical protein